MDCAIFWGKASTPEELRKKLQADCNRISEWIHDNDMKLNFSKTRFILNRPLQMPIVLAGTTFYPAQELTYLGLKIIAQPDVNYLRIDLKALGTDLRRRASLLTRSRSLFGPHMQK